MNNYYRNKRLRESAKHESCVSCGADDGTIVLAHSNEGKHGKGMGIKAHDIFFAYLCHQCHREYDTSGKIVHIQYPDGHIDMEKSVWFRMQWEKSLIRACEKGHL